MIRCIRAMLALSAILPALGAGDDPHPWTDLFARPGQSFLLGAWWDHVDYRGSGTQPGNAVNLAMFTDGVGTEVDLRSFHIHKPNWDWMLTSIDYRGSAYQLAPQYMAAGKPFHWSMPLITEKEASSGAGASQVPTLAKAAAGDYDAYYVQAAQRILGVHPMATGPVIVRIGWEFNGGWFPWKAQTTAARLEFAAAFRRLVDRFRSVPGGGRFRFEWNVNSPVDNGNLEEAYPGDAHVDLISMDFYLFGTDAVGYFTYIRDHRYGLRWMDAFAAARGKPQAFAEWGVNPDRKVNATNADSADGDGIEDHANYAEFVRLMAAWMRDRDFLYATYWNSDLDYQGLLFQDGGAPRHAPAAAGAAQAATRFKREFGQPAIATSATATVLAGVAFSTTLQAGTPVAWSIVGGNPAGFALSGAALSLPPQAWASGGGNTRQVTVRATCRRGLTAERTIVVTVDRNPAQPVVSAASAAPSPVIGTTAALAASANDDGGEAALTYTWSASGPAPVTFSANGGNAAKASTATFAKAGSYVLTVTARDAGGLAASRAVGLDVSQTPGAVTLAPATATVAVGGTAAFTATATDQFGDPMPSAGATWAVADGGTISASGRFAATRSGGPFTVTATLGGAAGTAQVTIGGGGGATSSPGGGSGGGGCGLGGAVLACLAAGCALRARRRR